MLKLLRDLISYIQFSQLEVLTWDSCLTLFIKRLLTQQFSICSMCQFSAEVFAVFSWDSILNILLFKFLQHSDPSWTSYEVYVCFWTKRWRRGERKSGIPMAYDEFCINFYHCTKKKKYNVVIMPSLITKCKIWAYRKTCIEP